MSVVRKTEYTDEYELFKRYRQTGDKALRDEIISSYIYIADILSRKFINKGIEYDDIYQVACMGILYAVERFDPDKGVRFATYATPTVLGEIRRYFRDKGSFIKVPRKLYEVFYKAERIRRSGGEVSSSEIARILNLKGEEVDRAMEAGGAAFMQSLEMEAYADGTMSLSDYLGRDDESFIMIEDKDFVSYCLSQLTETEQKLIQLRYYEEKTQTETAEILHMSQMNVSRTERKILKKLKTLYFKE